MSFLKWGFYKSLKKEHHNLYNEIKKAYPAVNNYDHIAKQMTLPLQIILGIMLRVYQESVTPQEFKTLLKDIDNVSRSTCYNYIRLARIIDYIDDNRIFLIGLTHLYSLAKLLENKEFGEAEVLNSILRIFYKFTNADQSLSSTDEKFTNEKFLLAVEYVLFFYDTGMQMQLDKDKFSKLYDARYEWSKEDEDFVKKGSFAKDSNGDYILQVNSKFQYQLKDSNFINRYMEEIIKNNYNGKRARKEITKTSQLPASTKTKKKTGNEHTIISSTSYLTETIKKYINDNMAVNPKDLEALKKLQTELNEFIAKNSGQNSGGTK